METVDSFQGKQMDVVIMSCVRASDKSRYTTVGFVADVRRMNVAITRARRALWILGNADTLSVNPVWSALIQDAKHRRVVLGDCTAGRLFPNMVELQAMLTARKEQQARQRRSPTLPVGSGSQGSAARNTTQAHMPVPPPPPPPRPDVSDAMVPDLADKQRPPDRDSAAAAATAVTGETSAAQADMGAAQHLSAHVSVQTVSATNNPAAAASQQGVQPDPHIPSTGRGVGRGESNEDPSKGRRGRHGADRGRRRQQGLDTRQSHQRRNDQQQQVPPSVHHSHLSSQAFMPVFPGPKMALARPAAPQAVASALHRSQAEPAQSQAVQQATPGHSVYRPPVDKVPPPPQAIPRKPKPVGTADAKQALAQQTTLMPQAQHQPQQQQRPQQQQQLLGHTATSAATEPNAGALHQGQQHVLTVEEAAALFRQKNVVWGLDGRSQDSTTLQPTLPKRPAGHRWHQGTERQLDARVNLQATVGNATHAHARLTNAGNSATDSTQLIVPSQQIPQPNMGQVQQKRWYQSANTQTPRQNSQTSGRAPAKKGKSWWDS